MAKLGDLFVNVSAKGVEATNVKLGVTEKKATMASKAAVLLKTALLGIGAVVVIRSIGRVIKEAMDAELQMAKLERVLKSTGHAANMSKTELIDYADELQDLIAVEDDVIIHAEGIMLTFTKIGKEVFPDAIEAAANMSVMFGQDLQQSVIQLGTALNDPILGVGRLRRIGISFSIEQKKSIELFMKQNNIMAAQRVILDELQVEIGGVARAIGELDTSRIKKLQLSLENLLEIIGEGLLPIFADWADFAVELIKSFTDWSWLIPDITQAITGQVPEINKLTLAYSKLDDELQDIIEREGKYSIEVMAKLLELDERLRQEELKMVGGLQTLGEARDGYNEKLILTGFLTPELLTAVQDLMKFGYIPEKKILDETKDKRAEDNNEKERSIEITEDLTEAMIEHWKAEGTLYERLENIKDQAKEMLPIMQEYLNIMLAITYNLPYKIEQTEEEIEGTTMLTELLNGSLIPAFANLSQVLFDNSQSWYDWGERLIKSLIAVGIQMMALAVIIKFLEMLGVPAGALISAGSKIGLFQTPSGDMFAYREGLDMGKYFFSGMRESFNSKIGEISGMQRQQPTNIIIHTGDPSTFVEFVSSMPNVHKSKFYRDVTEKARLMES